MDSEGSRGSANPPFKGLKNLSKGIGKWFFKLVHGLHSLVPPTPSNSCSKQCLNLSETGCQIGLKSSPEKGSM